MGVLTASSLLERQLRFGFIEAEFYQLFQVGCHDDDGQDLYVCL